MRLPEFIPMRPSNARLAHAGLFVGSGCLLLSVGPLLVFVLLQTAFGAFRGNNGLGLGLWFAAATPFAVLAVFIGIVVDGRRKRSASASVQGRSGAC